MCGISGVISSEPLTDADVASLRAVNERLVHRGPDSGGEFRAVKAMLAMRRLSIIDLEGGGQPLFNENGDIAIVCNGEIYNHAALRGELQALGHRFSSLSDVETIVHAYEEWGNAGLARLRGMFAFALWDGRSDKLLLARDRLGEKPLYICRSPDGGQLWFASEMTALSGVTARPLKLSPAALNLFLTFQYVPEPLTPLMGLDLLPAGHFLELSPGQPTAEPVSYWNLAEAHENPSDPIRTTGDIISAACHLMGTADVPVAIALSGGIDSSLVAALTAQFFPHQLHAFTIGYEGRPETDERS